MRGEAAACTGAGVLLLGGGGAAFLACTYLGVPVGEGLLLSALLEGGSEATPLPLRHRRWQCRSPPALQWRGGARVERV